MAKQKIDLIRQALTASESSIRLARTLLNELERDTSRGDGGKSKPKNLPGVTGTYDGESMNTQLGDKYPVPENYASKSILVIGDTLKLVEDGSGKKFKQIEHVKRHKTSGILTKKEGKWAVVTPEGSYRVLAASVEHFGGNTGDEALVQLPAKNLQVPWAAVEKIAPKGQLEKEPKREQPKKEEKEEKPDLPAKPKEKQEKTETKKTETRNKVEPPKTKKPESKEAKAAEKKETKVESPSVSTDKDAKKPETDEEDTSASTQKSSINQNSDSEDELS